MLNDELLKTQEKSTRKGVSPVSKKFKILKCKTK